MAGALDPYYDYALIGTSLPLSILSAALARAGHSVLHVDEAEHYGGPWASITLTELVRLTSDLIRKDGHGRRRVGGILDASLTFPAYGALGKGKAKEVDEATQSDADVEAVDTEHNVPEQLRALNRHFAISLAPTLLPCSGPTIDVLVRSKVASYCTFRLLQETALCAGSEGSSTEAAAMSWPLRKVPSSKEDIFKDKSMNLVAKRKLMKLLQQASGQGEGANTTYPADQSFLDYLTSKEGPALPEELATEVAYGVALCSKSSDPTQLAMQRIRRHISSIGKYGNSAYLVGQYGGAGEMAQCYSRASAVQGSVFVLGHRISGLNKTAQRESATQQREAGSKQDANWQLQLKDIEGETRVGCVVGDADLLDQVQKTEETQQTPLPSTGRQAVGVLLLDRGMMMSDPMAGAQSAEEGAATAGNGTEERPPETALVVFPPETKDGLTVWAVQMGEGTFSCPKGTYLIYLTMAVSDTDEEGSNKEPFLDTAEDARNALSRARERVLHQASLSKPEFQIDAKEAASPAMPSKGTEGQASSIVPLMESYFVRQTVPAAHSLAARHAVDDQLKQLVATSLLRVDSPLGNIATSLDDATMQAEDLYWLLTSGRAVGGDDSSDGKDLTKRQQQARAQSEAMRRRLWRRGYTVGRGLGGTLDEEDTMNTDAATNDGDLAEANAAGVCDFFPVDEDAGQTGDDDA